MKPRKISKTFFLCLLVLQSLMLPLPAAPAAQILQAGASVVTSCPSGCKLVQNITAVTTREDANGVSVTFGWTLAQIPAEFNLLGLAVSAKLVLKDNKIVESDKQNVAATATTATLTVRGKILNRNINLSDVKTGTVTVIANAITKTNPTITVTAKEIVGNDGAEVNMLVKWTPPSITTPCLAERTVGISASAVNAGGIKFDGGTTANLSSGSATVRLHGLGLRRNEMKNLQASIGTNSVALACGITKTFQAFGGAQGSTP